MPSTGLTTLGAAEAFPPALVPWLVLPVGFQAQQVRLHTPSGGLGGGGGRAALTVQVEDRCFLQLEFPDVLQVFPKPLGVPRHSSG